MTASWDGTPCRIIGAKPQNPAYPGQRGLSWERRRALEMHMSDLMSSNISRQGGPLPGAVLVNTIVWLEKKMHMQA